jgi:glycine/D-amino acid oxidase-like deaminating enzyme
MHVAVIGAGITGCSTALLLARRGVRVTLIDQADQPFSGASRWNEGKIHLGYLYAGDPSLATARRLLPGGLSFRPIVEDLLSCSLESVTTPEDDVYLVHRDSVVSVDAMRRHVSHVTSLAASHPSAADYLGDISEWRELDRGELSSYDDRVLGGFHVPERSVSTRWVADRYVDLLVATAVDYVGGFRVDSIGSVDGSLSGPLTLDSESPGSSLGPFDVVVNAAWEGRLALDASLGMTPPAVRSHRFRLAVFLRASGPRELPRSAVVCTGPFGDVKNYGGRDFYLSWYPAGLVVEGVDVAPPPLPPLGDEERATVLQQTTAELRGLVPGLEELMAHADDKVVEGGWVYAEGRGSLADPRSSLHRRERVGMTRMGSYLSVDTGKYSIGPWLAHELVQDLLG